jgi:hypothetical protein
VGVHVVRLWQTKAAAVCAASGALAGAAARAWRPEILTLPRIAVLLCVCLTLAAIRPMEGAFILARSGPQSTYLWDASPYVAQLVSDKVLGDQGMQALEATAVSELAVRAKSSSAQTLTVSIVYQRTGAVSPAYGVATFNGVEKVCTIVVSRVDVAKNGVMWVNEIGDGHVPHDVAIKISGQLPPSQ